MSKPIITITTDFGDQFATSQLRAVIASLGYEGQVIENHSVTAFSISEGAFELEQIAIFSPEGSVHVGVVDPGVGSNRWGIIIKTAKSWLVGPNNGLLYPVAIKEGIQRVWRINDSEFGRYVTHTFHGRDIFIKAAVYLACGKEPNDFNCTEVSEDVLEKYSFSKGEVVHIDAYGNYKVYWPGKLEIGRSIEVKTDEDKKYTIPIVKTFDDVETNEPLAYLGSHGTLEIALNLSNASMFFKFKLGEVLNIKQI